MKSVIRKMKARRGAFCVPENKRTPKQQRMALQYEREVMNIKGAKVLALLEK